MSEARRADDEVLTLVLGDDALALSTAAEIRRLPGHQVTVLGPGNAEFSGAVAAIGAKLVSGLPHRSDALERVLTYFRRAAVTWDASSGAIKS